MFPIRPARPCASAPGETSAPPAPARPCAPAPAGPSAPGETPAPAGPSVPAGPTTPAGASPTYLASLDHRSFDNVPPARREALVRSAVRAFADNDYQGASTEAIARGAGISKGLLFFYFKNKRELYLSLMDYITQKIVDLVVDDDFYAIDDFFELMLYAARRKTDVLARFPGVLEFSVRAFYPEHRDIRDTMNGWTQRQVDAMFREFFKSVRFDRFRDDVDPREVLDRMIWMADGYMHQQRCLNRRLDIDDLLTRFEDWCTMFKGWAYKEEYR